jgi:dihydroorotate dehydrogenase
MNESAIFYRNKIEHSLYTQLLKPIFFLNDPEKVHDRMVNIGKTLGKSLLGRTLTSKLFYYDNPLLYQEIFGINFKNPIGLSAGFDKNAELTEVLPSVGFGFAEVGSITGKFCPGNPKPRLWRLPKSKSLLVYYGLKNDGCESIAARLAHKHFQIPVGISVAMTNCTENLNLKNAVLDYAKAFRTMEPYSSYITVNISCPNAEGGQPFIAPHKLDYLFDILDEIPTVKPIFIKLSPDLKPGNLDEILKVTNNHRVHGIICTNLTKNRNNSKLLEKTPSEKGGMSGKIVTDLADQMLAYIYKNWRGRFVLIGSGGVFSAEDAYRKIRLGASLVQVITGMIYEGPQVISMINQGLSRLLARDGFKNISEAIGVDNI